MGAGGGEGAVTARTAETEGVPSGPHTQTTHAHGHTFIYAHTNTHKHTQTHTQHVHDISTSNHHIHTQRDESDPFEKYRLLHS